MRNYLTISVGAAMLAGILAAGGCVPRSQYDEAVALNGKAQRDLKDSREQLRLLEEERVKLEDALALRNANADTKDLAIANLNTANEELKDSLAKLKDEYDKAQKELDTLRDFKGPLPAKVDSALKKLAAANRDLIEYESKYGMLKIKSDLTFAAGSVKIKPAAIAALKQLGTIVNSPEAKKFHVYVAGHTDDQPLVRTKAKYGTNWGLSAYRAIAVIQALFNAGVEQPRMAAVAFSKYHPIAPNKPNAKGNPVNRRVELWIVPPDRLLTTQAGAGK